MAYRHTLGVAASTLALAVTCLAGAAPASAATTTSFSTTVSIAAERSASGLPSAAEIEEAKKDKDSTNAMIARLEASLASSRAELLQAETAAAEAQESLLTAGEERDLRTADAEKAVKQLEYAKQYLEQSQTDLGAIASDIYRNGAGNSTLGILLNSDDSNDLFYKAATIDTLSQQQVQSVNSATEAEALVSAWESYADAAQSAANEAAANYDASASTANSTLAAYQSSIKPEQELRDELISNLASLKDQEEAEVRKQVEEQEEAERETALQETIRQELEVDQSTAKPTVKPKPEAQPLDTVDTATPTAAPQPESAPKPQKTETPQAEETQAPAETPKAEETPAPKETPKATQKPKETPKATQKPKPKAEAEAGEDRSSQAGAGYCPAGRRTQLRRRNFVGHEDRQRQQQVLRVRRQRPERLRLLQLLPKGIRTVGHQPAAHFDPAVLRCPAVRIAEQPAPGRLGVLLLQRRILVLPRGHLHRQRPGGPCPQPECRHLGHPAQLGEQPPFEGRPLLGAGLAEHPQGIPAGVLLFSDANGNVPPGDCSPGGARRVGAAA